MKVYLVQHGEAKPAEIDPSRGLTPKGIQDATKVAEFLSKTRLTVHDILHSGKTRAKETTDIFAAHITVNHNILAADSLSPNEDPHIWADRLRGISEDTMLVGHLPHLAKLASILLCGELRGPVVTFRNAGVVCIARSDKKSWSLEWTIIPDIIKCSRK